MWVSSVWRIPRVVRVQGPLGRVSHLVSLVITLDCMDEKFTRSSETSELSSPTRAPARPGARHPHRIQNSPTEFLISKILAAGAARGRAWVGPTRARVFQTRVARARVGLALTHTLDGRLASFASGRGGCAAVCGARTPGGR